jgi:recombination protein RecA
MAKDKVVRAKPKDLAELIKAVDKEYGGGSLIRGQGKIVNVDTFPIGVPSIDRALGSGIPRGRIIELYGTESSGKTTTCLSIIAACQNHTFKHKKAKGVAAIIDAEHALDPEWAKKIGVNMDELIINQPDSGEDAFNILERLVDSGLIDLIVVDSVAALVPSSILEGEIGEANVGAQARLMSKGLLKIKGKCNRTGTTVIFINQIREKIGVMFGNPETTPGGRALKFYASIRAEVRKGSPIKVGEKTVGFSPTIKMVKNKVAPPFMSGSYDICFGLPERPVYGIDALASLFELAEENGIVTKNGSFYYASGQKLGNGVANSLAVLRENTVWQEDLRKKVYEKIVTDLPQVETTEESDEESEDGDDTEV